MNAQQIRQAYLAYFQNNAHAVIPRALLVPQNDPTTLFTGSGMQPLIPYLLGETHPDGTRLVDSQTSLRAQDIDEIGDNRHTTFFEMLGNWSLGDYFKDEQLPWIFDFLTNIVGLDPARIYVTCCSGFPEYDVPKDTVSGDIWKRLFAERGIDNKEIEIGSEARGYEVGEQGGRIFYYDEKNWWSRNGAPRQVAVGEPCGPDSELFYLFPDIEHDQSYGKLCHPNCDCGRYIELGNSVFMEYLRTEQGFEKLPKRNVDYGGGLERIAAARIDSPDVYKISLMWPIIEKIQQLSGKSYTEHTAAMRIIADHLRAGTFLAVDGIVPSNKEQGYVMRRLLRRAVMKALELGIEQNFLEQVIPVIADLYVTDFPEVKTKRDEVIAILIKEEKIFRQTLRKGLAELTKISSRNGNVIDGASVFTLYDTYGYPVELTTEVVAENTDLNLSADWQAEFDGRMEEQRNRSRTATKGEFKGGLGGQTLQHKKYHTATHLMYQALRTVLGEHVIQRGSNITEERLRFDFSHDTKVTPEQLVEVEQIVNRQITNDLPVFWKEYPTKQALEMGALGAFGDRYGEIVKIYQMGEGEARFSFEICGGPHVDHTGQLGDDGKRFKIIKEEASSAGIRRIKAVLV